MRHLIRVIKRDSEGHLIILKERIHQEDKNIINMCGPHIGAAKYIKKIMEDFKKRIDSNAIIVGDLTNQCQKCTDLPKKYEQTYCVTEQYTR